MTEYTLFFAVAACVLLLRWLKTKGCTVFANL